MAEKLVAMVGCALAFCGLISGIIFRTEGLTICFVGLIIMLFGMYFDEEV